ncbi:MAG: cytochrome c3 family protein [Methylobacter sp.]
MGRVLIRHIAQLKRCASCHEAHQSLKRFVLQQTQASSTPLWRPPVS